jgi:hypothetical protein
MRWLWRARPQPPELWERIRGLELAIYGHYWHDPYGRPLENIEGDTLCWLGDVTGLTVQDISRMTVQEYAQLRRSYQQTS